MRYADWKKLKSNKAPAAKAPEAKKTPRISYKEWRASLGPKKLTAKAPEAQASEVKTLEVKAPEAQKVA